MALNESTKELLTREVVAIKCRTEINWIQSQCQ
jgi:hypothetical protein